MFCYFILLNNGDSDNILLLEYVARARVNLTVNVYLQCSAKRTWYEQGGLV